MNYDVLSKFIDENKTKITEVIVLGHSMLGVDEPYYRDVIVPKLKDVHWDVYWHKFDDASIFIEKYKLPEAKSKEWSIKCWKQNRTFILWIMVYIMTWIRREMERLEQKI